MWWNPQQGKTLYKMRDRRMKLAIVGTSKKLLPDEETKVKDIIRYEISRGIDMVISGGAYGIDWLAVELASKMGIPIREFKPRSQTWPEYRRRNILIAQNCDRLVCLSTKVKRVSCYHCHSNTHEKTAGCWTMNEARKLNRPVKL